MSSRTYPSLTKAPPMTISPLGNGLSVTLQFPSSQLISFIWAPWFGGPTFPVLVISDISIAVAHAQVSVNPQPIKNKQSNSLFSWLQTSKMKSHVEQCIHMHMAYSLANFEKQPMGEFVKIEIRPLLTKIDAKFSFSAIKIKISTL